MDFKKILVISEIINSQNNSLKSDEIKYIKEIYGEDFIKENNLDQIFDDIIEENITEIVKETREEKYITDSDESDNNRFKLCFYYVLHILSPIKNYRRIKKWING